MLRWQWAPGRWRVCRPFGTHTRVRYVRLAMRATCRPVLRRATMKTRSSLALGLSVFVVLLAAGVMRADRENDEQLNRVDADIRDHAAALVRDGRNIFRF